MAWLLINIQAGAECCVYVVKCVQDICRHTCPALLPVFAQPHYGFHFILQLPHFTSQNSSHYFSIPCVPITISQLSSSIAHSFFTFAAQLSPAMSPTAYDTWLVGLREDNESVPSTEEQEAFLDFLNQKMNAEEAAQAYTRVVTNSKYQDPDTLWLLLWQAAEEWPETHGRLVELLKAILRLPPIKREGKAGESSELDYWSGLPEFEFGLREYWDGRKPETTLLKRTHLKILFRESNSRHLQYGSQNTRCFHQSHLVQRPHFPRRGLSAGKLGPNDAEHRSREGL